MKASSGFCPHQCVLSRFDAIGCTSHDIHILCEIHPCSCKWFNHIDLSQHVSFTSLLEPIKACIDMCHNVPTCIYFIFLLFWVSLTLLNTVTSWMIFLIHMVSKAGLNSNYPVILSQLFFSCVQKNGIDLTFILDEVSYMWLISLKKFPKWRPLLSCLDFLMCFACRTCLSVTEIENQWTKGMDNTWNTGRNRGISNNRR